MIFENGKKEPSFIFIRGLIHGMYFFLKYHDLNSILLIFLETELSVLNSLVYHMSSLVMTQEPAQTQNLNLNKRAVFRFGVHQKDHQATKVCVFSYFHNQNLYRPKHHTNMLEYRK